MKRFLSAVLLFLYLVPASGLNISIHYCGGEFASFTINGIGKTDKCTCDSEQAKKKCCDDKALSFTLTDNQYKTPPPAFLPTELSGIDLITGGECITPQQPYFFVTYTPFYILHPPDCIKQPLYILHQVFLI
jgi:hypothetical protein